MSVLKRSDPSLPQTRPSFSRAPGLLPAPTPADGGECRIVPEAALDQTNLNRWGAGTGAACIRDAIALAELSEPERKEWQAIWAEVEALLKRAQGQTPATA